MNLRNKHRTVKGLIVIVSTVIFCIFSYCRTMAFEDTTNVSVNQLKKIDSISTEKNKIEKKPKEANTGEGKIITGSKGVSTNTKGNLVSKPKSSVNSDKKNKVSDVKNKEVAVNSDRVAGTNSKQTALFTFPANGRISSFFGYRKVVLNDGTVEAGMHDGIDIAVPLGTKIGAAMSGEVEFVGVQQGYGNVIILRHSGGLETLYGHCSKIEVKKGDKVNTGDEIGKAGSTGRSTGPHIHFEVRVNGTAVDPLKYLNTNIAHK